MKFITLSSLFFSVFLFLPSLAEADALMERFSPNMTIADGKDGRIFAKCAQHCKEAPLTKVTAKVSRVSGGGDTYINARFGNDGRTFNDGKRIPVVGNRPVTVTWTLPNQSPGGQPLVINAYNGTVVVHEVTTWCAKPERPPRRRGGKRF